MKVGVCNLSGKVRHICGVQIVGSLEWKEFHNENYLQFLNIGVLHGKEYPEMA